jgi:hypothetical protein
LLAWFVNQPNIRNRLFRSKGGLNKIQANTQAQAETDKSTDAVVTASSELDVTHIMERFLEPAELSGSQKVTIISMVRSNNCIDYQQ